MKVLVLVLLTILHGAMFEGDLSKSPGKILGFRVSRYNSIFPFTTSNDMMIPELGEGTEVTLRIIGHLANAMEISLTTSATDCIDIHPDTITSIEKESSKVGSVVMLMPSLISRRETMYFCLKSYDGTWKHQGSGYWAKLIVVRQFLSLPVIMVGIATCIFMAAVLNASLLSLLSLSVSELRAKAERGSCNEKKICRALINLRERGNLVILAFIPCIIFFKTAATVLLNSVLSGWLTVLIGSLVVVVVIEVAPRLRRRSREVESSCSKPTGEGDSCDE